MATKLILLISICLLSSSAFAQQGKVLVFSPVSLTEGEHLKDVLELMADREVELMQTLPALDGYDAVFMLNLHQQIIPLSEQQILSDFVVRGGALFIRGRSRASEPGDPGEPLWNVVRDSGIMSAATSIATKGTYGVKGTFTEGFEMSNPKYDPAGTDVGGLAFAQGLSPVLYQSGDQGGTESAWISPDPTIIFVLDQLWGDYAQDAFIVRVACNYFNLCQLDVDAPNSQRLELRHLPFSPEIMLPSSGRVVIFDLLGRVLHIQEASDHRFTLPAQLARGTYLVAWTAGDQQASIVIQHQ